MAFLQIPPPACPCLEEESQPEKENLLILLHKVRYLLQLLPIVELGNGPNRVSECRLKGFLTFIKCQLWYPTKIRIHRLKCDTGGSEVRNCKLQY
jgi:hypothetical protein